MRDIRPSRASTAPTRSPRSAPSPPPTPSSTPETSRRTSTRPPRLRRARSNISTRVPSLARSRSTVRQHRARPPVQMNLVFAHKQPPALPARALPERHCGEERWPADRGPRVERRSMFSGEVDQTVARRRQIAAPFVHPAFEPLSRLERPTQLSIVRSGWPPSDGTTVVKHLTVQPATRFNIAIVNGAATCRSCRTNRSAPAE